MRDVLLHKGGFPLYSLFFSQLLALIFVLVFLLSACSPSRHYFQVERYLAQQDYVRADGVIEKQAGRYGSRNSLLYFLDRAATLHYGGRYEESNQFLQRAKERAEELYTRSITSEVGALLTNDNTLPYQGEDFERVMIHLMAALNYAYLGELDEALVEARQVDHRLNVLNDRYDQKNVYKEDAFARYLSAILFEAKGELNDAWIAYRKAYEAYLSYQEQYGTPVPEKLKSDLLRLTDRLGLGQEHQAYQAEFGEIEWIPYREHRRRGEIIFIGYTGLSPVKEDYGLAVPVPDGTGGIYLFTVALPRFVTRGTDLAHAVLRAEGPETVVSERTVLVEDITAIAVKDLEDRIGRISAKAAARAATKYLLSLAARQEAEKHGGLARLLTDVGTNLFSLMSEQSDKRSWRTLPGQIQMARLLVPPGVYRVEVRFMDHHSREVSRRVFPEIGIRPAEKKFLGSRVLGAPALRIVGPGERYGEGRTQRACAEDEWPHCE